MHEVENGRYLEKDLSTPVDILIVGAGNISDTYLQSLTAKHLSESQDRFRIAGIVDLSEERAKQKANTYNIPYTNSLEEALAQYPSDIVLNITNPNAHAAVIEAALRAEKDVYSEKPLAVTFHDGLRIVELAKELGRRVGCAPDTFLKPDIQTARKLIDSGELGDVLYATATFATNGPESWHPSPAFLYAKGAGPLFDMGPYYLTALTSLLGPISEVEAHGRSVTNGRDFPVEVPTHISTYLKFVNGVEADGFFSFDGQFDPGHPHIEIVGTTGRLRLADPNSYEESRLELSRDKGVWWDEVQLERKTIDYVRGIGLADFARGSSRFTADMPLHILEVMDGAYQVNNTGETYHMTTTMDRPGQF